MDEDKRNLTGSPKRDIFKRRHKDLNKSYYASDADLCFISFKPRGVVAYIDYKGSGEEVTATEEVLYDEWLETKPVFIIEGVNPEEGPFTIWRYLGSEEGLEYVAFVADWAGLEDWEGGLRNEFRKKNIGNSY
ncbi:MAG: hypothetical protein ACYSYU_11160 [Planctomycetota bacterium]|jgi:hypothetical protein